MTAPNAANVFRDFVTDGVPSSGANQPTKPDIREWGASIEGVITGFLNAGGFIFDTKATIDASLAYAANTQAWVVSDAAAANNGVYRKSGGSGSGSWAKVAELPYPYVVASDVGAGTPSAIIATTNIPVSSSLVVYLPVFDAYTGTSVTVAFNGGSALTIKSNILENVQELVSGQVLAGIVRGSNFVLISDPNSAVNRDAAAASAAAALASQNAAAESADEAAASQADAEAARDIAAGYASSAVSQGNVPIYSTVAGMSAITVPAGIITLRVNGCAAVGDGGDALYIRVATQPTHNGKFRSADRFLPNGTTDNTNGGWWELNVKEVYPEHFMTSGWNSSADHSSFIQSAIDYAYAKASYIVRFMGRGYWGNSITVPSGIKMLGAAIATGDGMILGTRIRRNANAPLFSLIGTSVLSGGPRNIDSVFEDMEINGANYTSDVVQFKACALLNWQRVLIAGGNGISRLVLAQELMDSRFIDCRFDGGGSSDGTLPAFEMLSGSSYEATNQVYFIGCRFESYRGVAIKGSGIASNGAPTNEIYFPATKFESVISNHPAIDFTDVNSVHFGPIQIYSRGVSGNAISSQIKMLRCSTVSGAVHAEHESNISAASLTNFVNLNNCKTVAVDLMVYNAGVPSSGNFVAVSNMPNLDDISVRVFAERQVTGSSGVDAGNGRSRVRGYSFRVNGDAALPPGITYARNDIGGSYKTEMALDGAGYKYSIQKNGVEVQLIQDDLLLQHKAKILSRGQAAPPGFAASRTDIANEEWTYNVVGTDTVASCSRIFHNGVQTGLLRGNNELDWAFPIMPGSFTLSQINALPTTTLKTGAVAYCSNGAAGQPCMAIWNGSAWRVLATIGAALS